MVTAETETPAVTPSVQSPTVTPGIEQPRIQPESRTSTGYRGGGWSLLDRIVAPRRFRGRWIACYCSRRCGRTHAASRVVHATDRPQPLASERTPTRGHSASRWTPSRHRLTPRLVSQTQETSTPWPTHSLTPAREFATSRPRRPARCQHGRWADDPPNGYHGRRHGRGRGSRNGAGP